MKGPRFVPPAPDVMAQLYSDYQRAARIHPMSFQQYLAAIGYTNPALRFRGMDDGVTYRMTAEGPELISVPEQPVEGTVRVKVLLVDFPDLAGQLPVSHYENLLFSKGTHATGSMRDFYAEVTLGKVDVVGSVHGWLRLPQNYSYYTNGESGGEWYSYPRNAPRMAEDAVNAALDAGIDFSPDLDVFGRGVITALFIIHAGLGAELLPTTTQKDQIWSHKWSMRRNINVGHNLFASTYLTVPNNAKVGVCAHELGHLVFQWEDFYDPNYDEDGSEWDGAGDWDLMAGGSHNGNGSRPAHPAGLHKSQHRWIEVEDVDGSCHVDLPPYSETSGKVVKIYSPAYQQGQYLLLENRRRTGFDSALPGEGLLVWRVDEKKEMTKPDQPALLLVQADGRHQLQTPGDWNQGDAGDPFPGSAGRTSLSDRGNISTSFPEGDESGISLENIVRDTATGTVSLDIVFAGEGNGGEPIEEGVLHAEASPHLKIPDNDPQGVESTLEIEGSGAIGEIEVGLDIDHTYISDLQVALVAPSGQVVQLHDRTGGNGNDLKLSYSSSGTSGLGGILGIEAHGTWRLRVSDHFPRDTGVLNSWNLAIRVRRDRSGVFLESRPNLAIPDNDPNGVASVIHVSRNGTVRTLKVGIDVSHPFIGDLRIELENPTGDRVVLHNQSGLDQDDLKVTYEAATMAALAPLVGKGMRGDWTLRVADLARSDVGRLNGWSLEIEPVSELKTLETEAAPALAIPDDDAAGVADVMGIDADGTVQSLEVAVGITHTYIGDLRVELIAPSGERAVLHDRAGGHTRNLDLRLVSADSDSLAGLVGLPLRGDWILRVKDLEGQDTGTLDRWSLNVTYNPSS